MHLVLSITVTGSQQLELADFEGKFITRNYAHGTIALGNKVGMYRIFVR